jgi:hypothetical protein
MNIKRSLKIYLKIFYNNIGVIYNAKDNLWFVVQWKIFSSQ